MSTCSWSIRRLRLRVVGWKQSGHRQQSRSHTYGNGVAPPKFHSRSTVPAGRLLTALTTWRMEAGSSAGSVRPRVYCGNTAQQADGNQRYYESSETSPRHDILLGQWARGKTYTLCFHFNAILSHRPAVPILSCAIVKWEKYIGIRDFLAIFVAETSLTWFYRETLKETVHLRKLCIF